MSVTRARRITDYGTRLRRLLAIIPWIAARKAATFEEIAIRFGLTVAEVENELLLAACCGLPPYSPDRLIELIVDEDRVTADVPEYFRRPPRLSAADGFALLAAGKALLAVPGSDPSGPLARAMDKLGGVLGVGDRVAVELDAPEHLDALRAAAAAHDTVEIDYYSASRDEATTRRVDPLLVFTDAGHWYVDGYCHRTDAVLHFRVDRVSAVRPTGDSFEPRTVDVPKVGVFHPGPDTPVVTVELPKRGAWVAETYPVEGVRELKNGRLRVQLAISGPAFLERLLLRVGPTAKVVEPKEMAEIAQQAARKVLARYS
ncbi:MAG: WYL domain-containing protein [Actinobacteria bacterium]|nr:WYL domain-containing protein [Actinomycetota bacterium]